VLVAGLRRATKEEADHLSHRPLGLFTQTSIGMPRVRRVRIGEDGGRKAYLFSVTVPASKSGSNTNATFDHYVAAAVELPARVDGRVAILRRGLLRSPRKPHLSEVEEGLDPRLLDDFHVYASDPALAASVLDGALVDWLVSDGHGAYYEIVHDLVVAYQGRGVMLTRRQSLLGRARALAERTHAPSTS
jgi:hypothetical protein